MKNKIKTGIFFLFFAVALFYLGKTVFLLSVKFVRAYEVQIELIKPNLPATGVVDIMAVSTDRLSEIDLLLYNSDGNLIDKYKMTQNNNEQVSMGYHCQIDTRLMSNGKYFLKAEGKAENYPENIYFSDLTEFSIYNDVVKTIEIIQPKPGEHLNSTTTLKAQVQNYSSADASKVRFLILGKNGKNYYKELTATSVNYFYSTNWNLEQATSGIYQIVANLISFDEVLASTSISVYVDKSINYQVDIVSPSENQILTSDTEVVAKTNAIADDFYFFITNIKDNNKIIISAEKDSVNKFLYKGLWKVGQYDNGDYILTAHAIMGGMSFSSSIKVGINHTSINDQETLGSTAQNIEKKIEFLDAPEEAQKPNEVVIAVRANFVPDELRFKVLGTKELEFSADMIATNTFSFIWPTINFPIGEYIVKVFALTDGNILTKVKKISLISATINEDLSETENNEEQLVTKTAEKHALEEDVIQNDAQRQDKQTKAAAEEENIRTQRKEDKKEESIDKEAILPQTRNTSEISIDEEKKDESTQNKEQTKQTEQTKNLTNQPTEIKKKDKVDFIPLWRPPLICQEKNLLTKETCNEYLNLPQVCKENYLFTKEKCNTFLNLPLPCKKNKIFKKDRCQQYLYQMSIPKECLQANKKTQKDCWYFLNNTSTSCKNSKNNSLCSTTSKTTIDFNESEVKDDCLVLSNDKQASCREILKKNNYPKECSDIFITDKEECNRMLFERYGINYCKYAGIKKEDECRAYIKNLLISILDCRLKTSKECFVLFDKNFGEISSRVFKFAELASFYFNNQNNSIELKELNQKISGSKSLVPLLDKKLIIKLLPAKEKIIIDKKENKQLPPVIITIDSDGDGLTDDQEIRLGSDPNNNDSDGDGYDDLTEYLHGYNLSGPGRAIVKNSAVDEAIINRVPLEQPTSKEKNDKEFVVQTVKNKKSEKNSTKNELVFKGHAASNTVVSLFIYSDLPIFVTTKTDEFGNWQYVFSYSLLEGRHEVYVAVNDNTGKITKRSKPFTFFIKEAKAVDINDFITSTNSDNITKTKNMMKYYVLIAILFIIIGLALFILYFKNYRQQNKEIRKNEI